jgi:hypothetical protein
MTNWDRLGVREWTLLADAPLAAGATVALASEGGGQREASAMVLGWREAARELGASPLIAALAAQFDPEEREQREAAVRPPGPPPSYDALLDEAITLCEQAVALLEVAAPADLHDYRAFVLQICRRVAAANSEVGLFGVGGEAVSSDERSVLRLIARALGA